MKKQANEITHKACFFDEGHKYDMHIQQGLKSAAIILKNCFDTVTS